MSDNSEKRIIVGVGVIIMNGKGEILFGHRHEKATDTGGIYEPGSWSLPGGKLEFEETLEECAFRETKEETGLLIHDPYVFSVCDDFQEGKHGVTVHVFASSFEGTPKVTEPDKMDAWEWHDLNDIPSPLYSPTKKALEAYFEKILHQ